MPHNVNIRYIADDVEAALGFYQLLGFEVSMHPAPGYAALERGPLRLLLNEPGAGGAGQSMPDGSMPEPGGWNRLQLTVEDLDATVSRLMEEGVEFRGDVVTGKGGRQILAEDPSGNPVELFEPPSDGSRDQAAREPVDSLERAVEVPVAPERAFRHFVDELEQWWPAEYTWSGAALNGIGMEPVEGGRCWEEGPHGFRCDWGRVLEYEPPHRVVFSWQIGPDRTPQPDPSRASEVEVRFVANGQGGTQVELVHSGFSRHGDGGAGYGAAMAAPEGWTFLLNRFAKGIE